MPFTFENHALTSIDRGLTNLAAIIAKAEAHCEGKKIDQQAFMQARLFPDMLPFPRQIQIAADTAKFAVARLAGVDAPKFDDNEASFGQLLERLAKTQEFVKSVNAQSLVGSDQKTITIPRRDSSMQMSGGDYLTKFVLPNLYFHMSTAYAILRNNGVDLGKGDFLGKLQD